MMSTDSTWVVASEYDELAFARLRQALSVLEYILEPGVTGMAGSQEICRWKATGPQGCLIIETETYIGLTVQGPRGAVEPLKARYAMLANHPDMDA